MPTMSRTRMFSVPAPVTGLEAGNRLIRSGVPPGKRIGLRRAGVATSLALLLSGCAHSLVYDENRHKQAQAAQQAVTNAHVANAVAAMEKTFGDVAAREERSALEYETYLFDLELKTVARASSLDERFNPQENQGIDGLATVLRARMAELGLLNPGQNALPNDTIRQVWRTDSDVANARATAQLMLTAFYGTTGHNFASCAEVYAAVAADSSPPAPSERFLAGLASDTQQRTARFKFAELVELCNNVDAAVKAHQQLYSGGLVVQLSTRVAALERDIQAYGTQIANARRAVEAATQTFKAASPPPGKSSLEQLQAHATQLNDALAKLVEAGGPAVSQVVAEERLARLEAVLRAIAGTPADEPVELPDDAKTAVAIMRALPSLKGEADKLFAQAAQPRLVPLLAALDQQKLVVQGFEARRNAKQKELAAAQRRLQAAYSEGVAAALVLQPIVEHPTWEKQSLKQLDATLEGSDRAALHRALGTYADEVQQARLDAAVWESREQAAQFEVGFTYSKIAAAQWDGLMDLMAKVLADYHAAGIKKSDIAEFFKAIGLVSIGVGAAQ